MGRLVQSIALGAAMVSLALGVWRDYGAYTALKRAVLAYLAAYFLAGGLGLATRAALSAVRDPEPDPEPEAETDRRRRRKRRPAPSRPVAEAGPAGEKVSASQDSEESVVAPAPAQTG